MLLLLSKYRNGTRFKNLNFLYYYSILVFMGSFFACNTDVLQELKDEYSLLEVGGVSVNDHTKSLIIDSIDSGGSIGIFVYDGSSFSYVSSNIRFIAEGIGATQSWNSDMCCLLGASSVSVYGYYPYNEDVTDITRVPLSMDEQVDYLYAEEVTGINQYNKRVNLSMYHALSVIRLRIKRSSDSNCRTINRMTIEGGNFSNQGSLNAVTGVISDTSDKGRFTLYPDISLSDAYQEVDLLVIPNGENTSMTAYLLLDNNPYESSLGSVKLEQGKIYAYDLTVTGNNLQIDGFSISPWVSVIGQNESLLADKYHEAVTYVDANGNEVFEPSLDCKGVLLTVAGQCFMIEKFESKNNAESTELYKTTSQSFGNTYITDVFSWGGYSNSSGVFAAISLGAGSTDTDGYLYLNGTGLNIDPSTWSASGGALSDFGGSSNSSILQNILDNGTSTFNNVPMSYLMNAFNDANCSTSVNQGFMDWYIPSCGQMGLIWLNKTAIDDALTAIGGTPLNSAYYYWTSTEYSKYNSWSISLSDGRVWYSLDKSMSNRVRLIRDY